MLSPTKPTYTLQEDQGRDLINITGISKHMSQQIHVATNQIGKHTLSNGRDQIKVPYVSKSTEKSQNPTDCSQIHPEILSPTDSTQISTPSQLCKEQ